MTPGRGPQIRRPPRGRRHAAPGTVRVAAVDVGSNSIRQVVADVTPAGAIRIVDEMKATPRLGAGLDASGALDPAAMRRALDALMRMAMLARQLEVDRVVAVATSAVRDAGNGQQFVELVRRETGLELRLLDGEEEARLAHRSALAHFDAADGPTVVMDVGGGSMELALSVGGALERLVSLPFGAIRLTERYLSEGPRRRDVAQLRKAVRSAVRDELSREWHGARLIASGGTFTTLAAMYLARRGISSARTVHGTTVPREELEHLLDFLQQLSPTERAAVPGLNPTRADIIVAGLAVAAEVLDRLDGRELVVSAYGIREGLLLESAEVEPEADPRKARERSVVALARRCRYEAGHARQVRRLALQLFDALGESLGAAVEERQLLADAALLHDVGYHVSYRGHHKHSYHLIVHAELLGMTPEEQVVLANIARYHRGGRPRKKKHASYADLSRDARHRVERLAALLRVADGLDRGHVSVVRRVRVRRSADGTIELRTTPREPGADQRLELWGAARKAGLLARVAGVPVQIRDASGAIVEAGDEAPDGADAATGRAARSE